MKLLSLIFLCMALLAAHLEAQSTPPDGKATLQFPNNPVSEIASYYEFLTGKKLILDAKLDAGPKLSVSVPGEVSVAQAASLIEASLLLNGYTLVPVDAHTSKLMGPEKSKEARSESVPLYADEARLPDNDALVSYFMPFQYLSSEDAIAIFKSYVAVRPYGSLVSVPNANALVITENVPLIRRLIALKSVVDVPGSKSSSVFFTLQRADATKVAEFLDKLFDKESGAAPHGPQGAPPQAGGKGDSASPPVVHLNVQVIPDTRTNRVFVVAPEQEMPYIRQIVESLDGSAAFEEPYECSLRYVLAADVLPVLSNILSEGQDSKSAPVASAAPVLTPPLDQSSNPVVEGGGGYGGGSGGANGPLGAVGAKPDKLRSPSESTAPLSVIVGSSRIIADRSSNKIIVIGPPESRFKAARVLQMLDHRPKQIYLATIIGQLTLGKGVEFGIDYLVHYGNMHVLGQGDASGINNLLANRAAGVDLVPGTSQLATAANSLAQTATQAASSALPALSGLTFFGSFGDSIDIFAKALASTDKFKVISRPVIYTANNKRAVISSGQSVPIPETSLTSAVAATPQANAVTSTIGYVPVVLKLEVIPTINSNNEVTLTIAQQNDNVQEQVQVANNQVPVIGTQELTTTVTVPNRHTIILGGLITDQEQRTQTGIPFLRDVPGVGYLFSSTKKDVTRRELIVLIQPIIIDSPDDLQEANAAERAQSGFKHEVDLFEGQIPIKKALLPELPGAPKPPSSVPKILQNP